MGEWSDWSTPKKAAKKRKYSLGGLVGNFADDIESTVRGIGPGIGAFLRGAKYDLSHPSGLAYDLGTVLLPPLAAYNIATNKTRSHSLGRLLEGMVDSYQYTYGPLVPFYGDPWTKSVRRIYNNPMGPVLDALSLVTMGGAGVARAGSAAAKSGRVSAAVRGAGAGADALSIMRALNPVDRALIRGAGLTPNTPGALARARAAGALPSDLLRGGDLFVPATRGYAMPRGAYRREGGAGALTHVLKDPNFARELRKAGVSRALDTLPAGTKVIGSDARRARFDTKQIQLQRRKKTALVDEVNVAGKRMKPQEIVAAIARHMDVDPEQAAARWRAEGHPTGALQAEVWADPATVKLAAEPNKRVLRLQQKMARVADDVFDETMIDLGLMTREQIASNAMRSKRIIEDGAVLTPQHPRDRNAYQHPSERVASPRGERAATRMDEYVATRMAAVDAMRRQADDLDAVGVRSSRSALKSQRGYEASVAPMREKAHAKRMPDSYSTPALRKHLAAAYNEIRYGKPDPSPQEMRRYGKQRKTIDKMLARAEDRYRRALNRDMAFINGRLSDAEYKLHMQHKTLSRQELDVAMHGKSAGPVSAEQHVKNIIDNTFMTRQQREDALRQVAEELDGFDDVFSVASLLRIGEDEAASILANAHDGKHSGALDIRGGISGLLDKHMYSGLASETSYRRADWVKDAAKHYVNILASGEPSRFEHFLNGLSDSEEAVLAKYIDLDTAEWAASHGAEEFRAFADEWFASHGFTPEHVAGVRRRVELEQKARVAAQYDDFDAVLDEAFGEVAKRAPKLAKKVRDRAQLSADEKRRLQSLLRTMDRHRARGVEAASSPYRRRAEELRRAADRLEAKTFASKKYQRMQQASKDTMPAKLSRPELVAPDGSLYRDTDAGLTAAEIRGGSDARYFPMTAHASTTKFGGRSADAATMVDPLKTQTVVKRNTGSNITTGRAALDLDAFTKKANSVIHLNAVVDSWQKMVQRGVDPKKALDLLNSDDYVLLLKRPEAGLKRKLETSQEAKNVLGSVIEQLDLQDKTVQQLFDAMNDSHAQMMEYANRGEAVIVPRAYAESMMKPYSAASRVAGVLNKGMDVWRFFVLNLVPRWVVNDVVGGAFMVAVKHSGPALWGATYQYLKETGNKAAIRRWASLAKRDASRLERGLDSPSQHSIDGLLREHYGNIFGNSFISSEASNSFLTRVQRKKMGSAFVRAATAYPDAITWMDRMLAGDVPRMILAWKILSKEAKAAAKLHPDEYAALSNYERVAKLLDDPRYSAAKDRVNEIVLNDLIDYGSLSKFEREWLRGVVPFYSWLRGITVWSKDLMLDQPVRANVLWNLGQQGVAENDSYGLSRDYMRGYFKIGDGKYVNTASLNPLATVGENVRMARGLWNLQPTYGANPIIHLNPLLRGFYSASAPGGKDPFSGAPILNPFANPYVDRGANGGAGTFPGRYAGSIVNSLPAVDLYWKMRNGSRPYSVYDMRGRDYALGYLGVPIKKVDESVASVPLETRRVY